MENKIVKIGILADRQRRREKHKDNWSFLTSITAGAAAGQQLSWFGANTWTEKYGRLRVSKQTAIVVVSASGWWRMEDEGTKQPNGGLKKGTHTHSHFAIVPLTTPFFFLMASRSVRGRSSVTITYPRYRKIGVQRYCNFHTKHLLN
jgi:hypothetical protein